MPGEKPNSFHDLGRDPAAWRHSAVWLKTASDMLRYPPKKGGGAFDIDKVTNAPSTFLLPTALMLLGLSFENLIKGLIVAAEPSVFISGGLDREFAKHDCSKLAAILERTTSERISPAEMNVIEPLEQFVLWGGRYPTPSQDSEFARQLESDGVSDSRREAAWKRLFDLLSAEGTTTRI